MKLNFVQESFGFYAINPNNELFYDITLGNDELFKKFYEKLQKIGNDSSYSGKVKGFLNQVKEIATKKIDKSDELETKIYQLFKINEISEDVIVRKWMPCLKILESFDSEKVVYLGSLFSRSLVNLAGKTMVGSHDQRINSLILEMSARLMKIKEKDSNEENHMFLWLNAGIYDANIHLWNVMNKIAYDDECNSLELVEAELSKISSNDWDNLKMSGYDDDSYGGLSGCALPKKINQLIEKFHKKLEKVGSYKIKRSEPARKFFESIKKRAEGLKSKS